MQQLIKNTKTSSNIEFTIKKDLKLSDIEKFYQISKVKDFKIGLEYERLSLDKNTFKTADYNRVKKIIEDFASVLNWDLVYDFDTIIGAKDKNGNSISLEPGNQFEISLAPYEKILDIQTNLNKILNLLDKIADLYGVLFLGYGINPVDSVEEINLLNKKRYNIMNNYLPNCPYGELATKMMRKTAGIQVNIDYQDKDDIYNKLYFLNLISPFVSGLFSNSLIENSKKSEFKSARSHIWRYTGKERCNLFYKNIFKGFSKKKKVIKRYIEEVLKVSMIFIERDEKLVEINGKITFEEFLKSGFNGYSAEHKDYILHQSLCFPDVRLKQYIEIRNHDSNNPKIALSLCAFYKGLFTSNLDDLIQKFSYLKIDKVEEYFINSSKFGLDFKINQNLEAWNVVADLFKIASSNLSSLERTFLNPIFELIKIRKTPSDLIKEHNFESINEAIDYILDL